MSPDWVPENQLTAEKVGNLIKNSWICYKGITDTGGKYL